MKFYVELPFSDILSSKINSGEVFQFYHFYGHKQDSTFGPWMLSQWAKIPFFVNSIRYPTAEHFMMSEKAKLFKDDDVREKILSASTPKEAKEFGRMVRGFNESAWRRHRYDIVVRGNIAKFAQNDEAKKFLLATKPAVLVEANPYDKIWGIGISKDHAYAMNPSGWPGLNLLGFALMEVRKALAIR